MVYKPRTGEQEMVHLKRNRGKGSAWVRRWWSG